MNKLVILSPVMVIVAVVVIALASTLSRRSRARDRLSPGGQGGKKDSASAARRTVAYIAAFIGLLATLYAASGLLAVAFISVTLQSSTLLGAGDVRTRTSFYLAALIVGLPLWLVGWLSAERGARRFPEERDAGERLLFLAAVFAVTSVMALFALRDALDALFTWPGPADAHPSLPGAIAAGVRVLVYGGAWLAYARIGWRERSPRDDDGAHDLAVYVLSAFALAFLIIGLNDGLRQLIGSLVTAPASNVTPSPAGLNWTIWGSIAAWIVAGGAIWAAIWRYDMARGGQRRLRVQYLYIVWLLAAPATLLGAFTTLNELLRTLLGYQAPQGNWVALNDTIPPLVLGALAWAYHWSVLRRQAPSNAAGAGAGIRWPRRPAMVLLALGGLGMAAPALISILWLGLDFTLHSGGALSGPDWWRNRLSLGIAGAFVGALAWLSAWALLQRAAADHPAQERTASERRLFLWGVTVVAGLAAIGFVVASLWLALRAVLGDTLDANAIGTAFKYVSAAVVLVLLALYHGVILRQDVRSGPARRAQLRLVAMLAPGAEEALTWLRQSSGRPIEVVGYLGPDAAGASMDLAALGTVLANLDAPENARYDNALLVLHPHGGHVHLFARRPVRPSPAPVDVPPAPDAVTSVPIGEALGEAVGAAGS